MKIYGKLIFVYIMLLMLLITPVFGASGCMSTSTDNGPSEWAGTWDSGQWGEMKLTQNGSTVTGTYTWDEGKIEGTVFGNMLRGTWSESPSYSSPDDAGDFEFTLSSDDNSFTGKWRYGSDGDWDGDWTAEKTGK